MIGIIVQLAVTWLLARIFEKKGLGILGLMPTKKRAGDFAIFFIVTAVCAAMGFIMRIYFGERWQLNPTLNAKLFAAGLWWNIKSVLFEELIFRGIIFYILIKRLGVRGAIIISSIAFGIYHWFSMEVWGDSLKMLIVFIMTGAMGSIYSYGYAKTFSLFIPIAIHLGWNFTNNFIFSEGQIGNGVLVAMKPAHIATVSWPVFLFVSYFPFICAIVINYWLLKRKTQVAEAD